MALALFGGRGEIASILSQPMCTWLYQNTGVHIPCSDVFIFTRQLSLHSWHRQQFLSDGCRVSARGGAGWITNTSSSNFVLPQGPSRCAGQFRDSGNPKVCRALKNFPFIFRMAFFVVSLTYGLLSFLSATIHVCFILLGETTVLRGNGSVMDGVT